MHQFKTLRSQLESDLRLQKSLAATAKKFQSELAKLKNEGKKLKDSGAGDKPNSEYEMLLSEKDALIAEYLSGLYNKQHHSKARGTQMIKNKLAILEINRKDEEKSARISCPICFDEISEKRKWTAFHPCGHRTCSNCFIGITADNQGDKPCPICRTVISVSVTLEGIY